MDVVLLQDQRGVLAVDAGLHVQARVETLLRGLAEHVQGSHRGVRADTRPAGGAHEELVGARGFEVLIRVTPHERPVVERAGAGAGGERGVAGRLVDQAARYGRALSAHLVSPAPRDRRAHARGIVVLTASDAREAAADRVVDAAQELAHDLERCGRRRGPHTDSTRRGVDVEVDAQRVEGVERRDARGGEAGSAALISDVVGTQQGAHRVDDRAGAAGHARRAAGARFGAGAPPSGPGPAGGRARRAHAAGFRGGLAPILRGRDGRRCRHGPGGQRVEPELEEAVGGAEEQPRLAEGLELEIDVPVAIEVEPARLLHGGDLRQRARARGIGECPVFLDEQPHALRRGAEEQVDVTVSLDVARCDHRDEQRRRLSRHQSGCFADIDHLNALLAEEPHTARRPHEQLEAAVRVDVDPGQVIATEPNELRIRLTAHGAEEGGECVEGAREDGRDHGWMGPGGNCGADAHMFDARSGGARRRWGDPPRDEDIEATLRPGGGAALN